jgi:hypothetical protein
MRQDIAVYVDAGRDFNQLQPVCCELKHASLGNEGDGLIGLGGKRTAERDLLNAVTELPRRSLLRDLEWCAHDRNSG